MIDYKIQVVFDDYSDYLDLYPDNINVDFTFDIADVKNLTGRNSSYSYPIKVPASDKNKQIFGYINELSKKLEFDPRKQLRGYYFRNSILVFEGFLRYEEFVIDGSSDSREFSLIFYGDNDTIYNRLNGKFIDEIDLSAYDHRYDKISIVDSWTQSAGFPYRYPLIDYGYNWSLPDISNGSGTSSYVEVEEMFPAVSKKIIFDRIFQEAGMSYVSDELNSEDFKNEYIPFSKAELKNPFTDINLIKCFDVNGTTFSLMTSNVYDINFNTIEINTDSNWGFSGGKWRYTNDISNQYSISTRFVIKFDIDVNITLIGSLSMIFRLNIFKSNTLIQSVEIIDAHDFFYQSPNLVYTGSGFLFTFFFTSEYINLEPGEDVYFTISKPNTSLLGIVRFLPNILIYNEIDPYVKKGNLVRLSSTLPPKISQLDFISSIIKERNLMIDPIRNKPNTFLIEPRDKYYSIGEVVDWSKKLDNNKDIIEKSIADDKDRIIKFTHKEDKDFYNIEYKQAFSEIYGEYTYDTGNEHTKSTKRIETIFSPTPLVNVPGSIDFPIPVIVKDGKTSYNQTGKGRIDSNIRSLYWGGLINFSDSQFNNTFDRFAFEGNIYTFYPYMGHLSNPYSPTQSIDLNFGEPRDVYFRNNGVTDDNLFKRYWEKTILELTDKDSRLITCWIKLSPDDIYNLRFNSKIWLRIDGNGQYYRLNKIFSWNPNTLEPCKVELILAKDVTLPPKKIIKSIKPIRPVLPPRDVPNTIPGPIRTGPVTIEPTSIKLDTFVDSNSSGLVATGREGGNIILDSDSYLVLGDGNRLGNDNNKVLMIGGSQSVGDMNKNIILIGDDIIVGSYSQNVTVYGNGVEVGSDVKNVFSIGDGLTITQSNSNYIGGNTIFGGTVSFSQAPQIGLQDVIDYNNQVRDTKVDILDGNITSINRDTSIYDIISSPDSISINSPDSFMSDVYGVGYNSMINANLGSFITFSSYSSIMNSMNCFIENGNRALIISGFNNSMESTSFSIFSGNVGSSIIGGISNRFISDGVSNLFSSIITGSGNEITNTSRSSIISGQDNKISSSSLSSSISSISSEMYNVTKSLSMMDDSVLIGTSSNVLSVGNSNLSISNSNSVRLFSSDNITIGGLTNSTLISVSGLTCSNSELPFSINSSDILMEDTVRSSTFAGKNNIMINVEDSIILGSIESSLTYSTNSIIIGGRNNKLSSPGGKQGSSSRGNSVIVGGSDNTIQTNWESGVIVGGINNEIGPIFGGWSTIVGGDTNKITGYYANVSGGVLNNIGGTYGNGNYSFIGGGWGNQIYGTSLSSPCRESGIVGGLYNTINTRYAFIGGGVQNTIKSIATQSSILGGQFNTIEEGVHNSVVLGGNNITATQSNTVYMPNVKIYGDAFIQGRLDLTKLGVESILRIIPSGSTPSTPLVGDVFYRDGTGLYYWNGTKWVVIGKDPVEFNQISSTQSLTVNNTTSALTNITGWTFSFDADSYYQFEGYIDASITSPASAGPNMQNFIGLCVDFTNSITHYNLTITDIQNLYASTWGAADSVYHVGNSRSSNVINRDAIIRGTTGRMRVEGFVRTSAATTGQFKWTYRNDTTRTFNILSGSVINIIKM